MEEQSSIPLLNRRKPFELCREFVLWDFNESTADLISIIKEFQARPLRNHVLFFISIALLTNTLILFIEATYKDRWEIFEDQTIQAKRQYVVIGVLYLMLPILLSVMLLFTLIPYFLFFAGVLLLTCVPLFVGVLKTWRDYKNYKSAIKKCA